MAGQLSPIRGIVTPVQRDAASDLANASGDRLSMSKIIQVAMTDPGEIPWRTNFGAGVNLLRHQNNDAVLAELARVRIRDALTRWAPDVEIAGVDAVRNDTTITLTVRYRIGDSAERVAVVDA